MLEFILARYNYWIVICLMMTGLYIVFSRGNLVKTLIGLNLFQTSVFIFYITVGKVIGGTAPILIEDKTKDGHEDGHSDTHAGGHGEAHHSTSEAPVGFYRSGDQADPHLPPVQESHDNSVHGELADAPINDLTSQGQAGAGAQETASLHLQPPAVPSNQLLPNDPGEVTSQGVSAADASAGYGEVLYSNPLPHVLILTAIVVGVATTAVGLALAVRIREAYGTVEEDQLEAMDNASDVAEVAG